MSIVVLTCFLFAAFDTPVPDSSTLENTTGDVMSPPPDRGACGVLSPTSPTTDTEHTTGDCTNMTNPNSFLISYAVLLILS